MTSLEGYWASPEHRGTGLYIMVREALVAGMLVTLNRSGEQLALTFVADVDDLETTVFPLTHYAAKAWPGDGPHVTTDPAPAEGEMTLKLDGDTLEAEVGLAWPLVQRLRPSPIPPPGYLETFCIRMSKLL